MYLLNPIADLTFRTIRGADDAPALHAVRLGCMAHDRVDHLSTSERVPTGEHLRMSLSQALAAGRRDWWLVAEISGQVVGYSLIECWPEGDGTWVYLSLGWVLPQWRSRGIGTAMLHWAEDTIRRLAAAQHPGAKIEFAANASGTELEATALLLHEGYHVGYTVLEMGLDSSTSVAVAALPVGLEVRPATPDHYVLIAESVREAYQHEYDAGRYNDEFNFDVNAYTAELSASRNDPLLWQVAWDGNLVVGQVLSRIENGGAEVFEVSVRPAWRRRGLARGLLSRSLYTLRARGVDVIRLHTNADFPTRAIDLYRSVGFRVLKEFPRYRKSFI